MNNEIMFQILYLQLQKMYSVDFLNSKHSTCVIAQKISLILQTNFYLHESTRTE